MSCMTGVTVQEAEMLVMEHVMKREDYEKIPLVDAMGRILAEDIFAERDHPPYDRVMMDGIACRLDATFPLRSLGMQQAGKKPFSLPRGAFCYEVTTGSVLPIGAEIVIEKERLERREEKEGCSFSLLNSEDRFCLKFGQFIHKKGSDALEGHKLLFRGQEISAPEMAILAANNMAEISVFTQPSLAIITTGDELVGLGEEIEAWQIRRSNDYALLGSLKKHGFQKIEIFSVYDDFKRLKRLLGESLAHYDMLLLTGGVSAGDFDFVPQALSENGVEKIFHKVLQRPGGPLYFGRTARKQAVFALPGNPVSAMMCMARYVLPYLHFLTKNRYFEPKKYALEGSLMPFKERTRFVAVSFNEKGRVVPHPAPTSGDFMGLAGTEGMVVLEAGFEEVVSGSLLPFFPW